ncbi:LysR family transcriptional regulator [Stappia taiwanensis]|uniref:LysR family transcriptional regulator n=1 Tax=Stappia taiwanensis TaxID=992267 RepID=UPI001AD94B61|nr:LysR family transcriptional regulator [Stappia taiwanensis]
MTPASITRVIARLEQDLGQQLLVRTTRQVSLTSAGALVAARYRPVVEAFDNVRDELDRTCSRIAEGCRSMPPRLSDCDSCRNY